MSTPAAPVLSGWFATPRPAHAVQEGNVVELGTGELMIVTTSGPHTNEAGQGVQPAQWRVDLVGLAVPGGLERTVLVAPDYPTPVLVRRDALVGEVIPSPD